MIRPIIVVGMNRSGTKWVSNIVCGHEDVVGVQSRRTCGILETNMLGAMYEKFDLDYADDYVGLIELWSVTEFFRRAGVDKDFFYRLDPRPRNALQLFELLMNEVARREGKRYWLQKTPPVTAERALAYFTNARVIVVRRNLLDTARSTLILQQRYGAANLARAARRYAWQAKLLDRICRRYPAIEVRYEALAADPSREKARLFTELGLDPARVTSEDRFPRNTSFPDDRQRRQVLSRRDRLVVRGVAAACACVPLPLLSAAVALRKLALGSKPAHLVADSFGEIGDALVDRTRGPARKGAG